MMNFSLEYIEQNVSENFLVLGEQLVEQNAVLNLQEVEKHLWIATVDNQFEVEVKITPSKVTACSCECENFKQTGICEHLVGTFLVLRKTIAKKTQVKKTKPTQKKKDKLTINSILKNADQAALHTFIQNYASKNKNFAIALKARFASVVEFSDNKEKYLQLLDAVIKQSRKKDRTLSFHGERKLMKVADELFQQAELALDQRHYVTVRLIAESVIEKFTPIIRKSYHPSNMVGLVKEAFQLLHKLLKAPVAPTVLEDLWEYAIKEVKKITYKINEITPHFYHLLIALAALLDREIWLIDFLQTLSFEASYSNKNHTQLLISRITLLEQNDRLEEAQALIKDNLHNPDLLLFALNQSKKKNNVVRMKYLADIGLNANFSNAIHRQIADIRLAIATEEADTPLQTTLARQLLLQTFDVDYFHTFKTAHSGDWTKAFTNLVEDAEKLPFSVGRRDFVATLYQEEGKHGELMNYIRRLKSLDMLEKFDQFLLNYFRSEVFELYRTLIEDYITHHLGRVASKRVKQKLHHLHKIGGAALAEELVKKMRTEYADRQSLMEELAVF